MGVEAYGSLILHTVFRARHDDLVKHLLLWSRDSIDWGPLCSHYALTEGIIGDLKITSEELEIVARARKTHDLEWRRVYLQRNYVHEQRKQNQIDYRAADPVATEERRKAYKG